jgi:hypothetical protein
MSDIYVVRPLFRAPLSQRWLVETESKEDAKNNFATQGEFLSERISDGGDLSLSSVEAEEVTEEKAEQLLLNKYTVVGTSANHPQGFTRMVLAGSPEAASEQFEDAYVIAIFEGHLQNCNYSLTL